MKILIVHYRYFLSGGPERYLFNLTEALEERGHTVIPFSIRNSNNRESAYGDYFVRNIGDSDEVFVSRYPKTPRIVLDLLGREFYSFEVRRALERLIRAERPDVCYLLVYKRALSPSVIDACQRYGVPIVNRISDYNPVCGAASLYRNGEFCNLCFQREWNCVRYRCVKGSLPYSLARWLSNKFHRLLRMNQKIKAYVCTNQYMLDMMGEYGYAREKLHVIPTFFRENADTKSLDKSNIVDNKTVRFLFIGNLDETKGVYDLLGALQILRRRVTNFRLDIVGGLRESENQRAMSMIQDYGLSGMVSMTPFIRGKELFQAYLRANLTVIPARWVENLPNTLLESLYFHRPVVVPEFGSFLHTTSPEVSFRYQAHSVPALADRLTEICSNPSAIEEKSGNCESFLRTHYSEEAHLRSLLALFREVSVNNEDL